MAHKRTVNTSMKAKVNQNSNNNDDNNKKTLQRKNTNAGGV